MYKCLSGIAIGVLVALSHAQGQETPAFSLADAFEGSDIDSSLFVSKAGGVTISADDVLDGSKSLFMVDSSNIKSVDFNPALADELINISFKVKVKTAHDSSVDSNFLGADEIFHVNVGEVDRIPSNNPYSSKFSILKGKNQNKIRFVGYDRNVNSFTDTAMDSTGATEFPGDAIYDVRLSYSRFRMYVDINNGEIKTSYYSGREGIKNFQLNSRLGTVVVIDDLKIYGGKIEPREISKTFERYIGDGLFTGYVEVDRNKDGVSFSRMTDSQRILYGTSRGCAYQSGVWFDAYTNSKTFSMDYTVHENDYASGWPTQFDVFINGVQQAQPVVTTKKLHSYSLKYSVPQETPVNYRLTVMFPSGVATAITDVGLDAGSVAFPVVKSKKILMLGDSITQGSQCESPAAVYANQVAMKYNMQLLNQAVSGSSFSSNRVVSGDYRGFVPDVVILSWGTNNYAGGGGNASHILTNLGVEVPKNIEAIKLKFSNAKIIAITPIWRSDESGINFSLKDFIGKLKEVYSYSPEIRVLDGYNYVPHEKNYYNGGDLKLHPNSLGHIEYGKSLLIDLKAIEDLSMPDAVDWVSNANNAVEK